MEKPSVVTRDEWTAAREELLPEEKALTRAKDAMAAKRRQMPWMAVEKEYRFEGPDGPVSFADLFQGQRQLIVYRAFYEEGVTTTGAGTSYPERACMGCSFVADNVANVNHLKGRDTALAFVSRGSQEDIKGLKARSGWEHIPWFTITDDWDADFDVDKWHGHNAFVREGDEIYRTYFTDGRGDEALGGFFSYLDITALGRQEEWEESPDGWPQTPTGRWMTYADLYE